ncbi:uncharacterized protein V6R79_022046 [Siganus canaliculatus]
MEPYFDDLLSEAFSETSVPSFPDGDLDFENLNFEEKPEEAKPFTADDETLHQEATLHTADLSDIETKDSYMPENDDNVLPDGRVDETPEDDYTTDSEQEGSVSGEEENQDVGIGEKPGELLMSVRFSDEFCDGYKEDKIFAEGQPLAPEGDGNPKVRNEEQEESDEETSYFEKVPERGSGKMIKAEEGEETTEERESMKTEQEENSQRDHPTTASLDFPEISGQNLQDLIAEVECEEQVEKMKDFSGEEHQEAGESIADYPSDFSSCEYVEEEGRTYENPPSVEQQTCVETAVTDKGWMGRAGNTDEEEGEYLYSIDLEGRAEKFESLKEVAVDKNRENIPIVEHAVGDTAGTDSDDEGEAGRRDSYSSSDDEEQGKRSDEEILKTMHPQDLEQRADLEEFQSGSSAAWSALNDYSQTQFNINWSLDVFTSDIILSEDVLTTDDADKEETQLPEVKDRSTYSAIRSENTKTTSPSNQGSLDDGFFFSNEPEASDSTELGLLGDDEYEEDRNWEQEQERIKAFYEFYDDSDGDTGREGRQIKVQFCTDPLSQILHYETNSDRDSFSSSTDGEEDLSSAETSEELKEPDDTMQIKPACDLTNIQPAENEPNLDKTENRIKRNKCPDLLKMTLKMVVVILTGLLMFWVVTDQAGWISNVTLF